MPTRHDDTSLAHGPGGQRDEIVPSLVGMMPKEALGIIAKRWQAAWIDANAAAPDQGGRRPDRVAKP